MKVNRLSQASFNVNFGRKNEVIDVEKFDVKGHSTAKGFINKHNPSLLSFVKNSMDAGYPSLGDPNFIISINDFIVKKGKDASGNDTYESDRVHTSRNAAVDGNINISKINGEGSTLVAINYPVYKSKVSARDIEKAVKKYDKLVKETLKALK